jgi:N-acetylmuramoyl-L-alanine amidase
VRLKSSPKKRPCILTDAPEHPLSICADPSGRIVFVKFKSRRNGTKLSKIVLCAVAFALCSSVRAAEPSATPAAKSTQISTAEASKFVKEYYAALSRADIPAALTKFSESVNYREDRQRDRAFIEKDLHEYVVRWPILNLKPEAIAVSTNDDGATTITFNLVYSLENDTTKRSASGHSTNTWIVRHMKSEIQIISQREVVHANPAPASEKSPQRQSHEEEEALSDEELKKQGDMRIEIPPVSSTSKPSATPAKAARKNADDFVVALDIGHTPLKGGAVSARGVSEYEFNHRLVTELFAQLQSLGFRRSFIINPQGEEIRLAQRSAEANAQNADLFLAIHHDSVKDRFLKTWEANGKTQKYCDDFHGYSIFFSNKNAKAAESLAFANKLGQALLKAGFTPTLHHVAQENRPIIDKEKGIYAFDDLVVLKTARMPAVLLECGVIVNRAEEEKLNSPAYRKRLVDAIGRAIQDFSSDAAKDN